jgi:radical SAM protein with 4Fe4S-binding SPASM domain
VPAKDEGRYAARARWDQAGLWAGGGPRLEHIDIELTERCNNDCLHCYINRPAGEAKARDREMSAVRIGGILAEAASLGCLSVRFTGGEPLLRDDFEEIYLAARKLGLKAVVFTNATLVSSRLADLLARVPPLEPLEVTLYGMTRETYETFSRAPGSFDAAMAGIGLLRERKVPFVVKGAFLPASGGDLAAFEKWAKASPGMDRPPSVTAFYVLRARGDPAKNKNIARARPDPERGADIQMRNAGEYVRGLKTFLTRCSGKMDDRLFTCGAGVASCAVDAYGILQPCLLVRHPETVYDLSAGSLKEALENFFSAVRRRKAAHPRYLATCARCPLRGFCEQCPGRAWMESGTLDTPAAYFCEAAHVQARRLGLLAVGEMAWEASDWEARVAAFSEAGALERLRFLETERKGG